MGAAGVVLPAAVNEPRIGGLRLLVEGPAVRLNQVAAAPAAPEDVTLPAGTFTASFYGAGMRLTLSDVGRDKYGGRLVADIVVDGEDLCRSLLDAGLAVPYEGGRKTW